MKKPKKVFLIASFLFVCCINSAYSIDNYHIGDSLYVWAKNGLKLWEKPNINSKLIESIPFGWKIIVNEKTPKTFNVKVKAEISQDYTLDSTQHLILKGNWVKVKCTKTGNIGYLIDQYLLKAKPRLENPNHLLLVDEKYELDTISNKDGIYLKIKREYKSGITVTEVMTEKGNFKTYRIKNYSLEESFILIGNYWLDPNHAKLIKNWEHELIIYDGGMCEYSYSLKGNGLIVVRVVCSC